MGAAPRDAASFVWLAQAPHNTPEIMQALYSKAFGKKAVDLNKKDFKGKEPFSVTTKAKTGGGIEYEANANCCSKGDAKVTLPVDDKCKLSIKTDSGGSSTVDFCMKTCDASTVKVVLANPSMDFMSKSGVSAEVEYLDKAFSVEAKMKLLDGPARKSDGTSFHTMTGTNGLSIGFAAPVPEMDGATMGFNPSIGHLFGEKGKDNSYDTPKHFIACPLSVGYSAKDFQLAFTANPTLAPIEPNTTTEKPGYQLVDAAGFNLAGVKVSGHFKATDDLNVAFEFDKASFDLGKDTFAAFNMETAAYRKLQIGAEYKVSAATTLKGKVTHKTCGEKTEKTFDFALKTPMGPGKSSMSAGLSLSQKGPTMGVVYTLE